MRFPSGCWVLTLALATVLAGGCATGRRPATAADTAAIEAAADSLTQAENTAIAARDTNAIADCYTADARMLPPNLPRVEGRDAIRATWARMLAMPGLTLTLASGQKLVSESGDLVVDLGTYAFTARGPKGKPLQDTGKYVTVLKKVDGRWKMAVDVWNSDLAAPGTAKPATALP